MKKKAIFLTKRLIRILLLLALIIILVIGVVLARPMWVSSLITHELKNQGVYLKVQKLESLFSGTRYQVVGHFSARSPTLGVKVSKGNLRATVDWYDLLLGKPFVQSLSMADSLIHIDRDILAGNIGAGESNGINLEYILPKVWGINNTTITVDGHTFSLSGNGKSNKYATLIANDSQSGEVSVKYDKSHKRLYVDSQLLNLQALTGQFVILRDLNAVINTDNLLASRAHTTINYQGVDSRLDVVGQGDGLLLEAKSKEQTVSVTAQPLSGNEGVQVSFKDVDLAVMQRIAFILPKKYERPLLSGIVDGTVTVLNNGSIEKAQVTLNNVGVTHSIASVDHVFGDIRYENNIARFFTQLQNSSISIPSQFPDGLGVIDGKINGTFDFQKKQLGLQKINIRSDDFESLSASGMLDLQNLYIELAAAANNINIGKSNRLIPMIMPVEVRKWLIQALVSGKENSSEFTMNGRLKNFFQNSDSVFLLKSRVKNSQLHYLPNNPDINVEECIVNIDGTTLNVDVSKAKIKGVAVTGKAFIKDFLNADLIVNAEIKEQSIQKMLPIAEKSIAAPGVTVAQKILSAQGNASINLSLNVPLAKSLKKSYSFDVDIVTDNASLQLRDYPELSVEKAQTTSLINEKGLHNVNVNGYYNKQPLSVELKRDRRKNYVTTVNIIDNPITLLSNLKILNKKEFAVLTNANLINGKSQFKATQIFDETGSPVKTKVSSSLMGTSFNIFGALVKKNQHKLPLSVEFLQKTKMLKASLGNTAIQVGLNSNNHLVGLLLDNINRKKPYKKGSAQLYWHSRRLNLEALNSFREAFVQTRTSQSSPTPTLKYLIDVNIRSLMMNSKSSYPFVVKGSDDTLQVKSPLATGMLYYKKNQFDASFKHLNVSQIIRFVTKTEITEDGREVSKIDLAKALPQMQLNVDKILYKDNNVGKASIRTSIRDGRYSIDQILIHGDDYYFEASGYEAKEPQGIATKLQADFKGEEISQIVKLFKLQPILDGKFIDISANLSWPGKAHTLNLKQSYGQASLNAQNVKLVNVSSGIGGVLGLMDITSIFKRISMDFKNLSSSKISFDTVKGNWNIGGGRAITRNAYATGSLIDLKLIGAADLHRRQFDNINATVIPKASNVIPVVGAVAGGVVGAVIGVVVQKIAGKAMNKAVGLPYVISGKWENPIVTSGTKPPKSTPPPPKKAIVLESIQ
ncbi:MAG: hypothetical protein KGV50_04885 [Gammaproteobacteria bacterium]|nr:hypothetical protein [Gammaproteobacteria bacterium]